VNGVTPFIALCIGLGFYSKVDAKEQLQQIIPLLKMFNVNFNHQEKVPYHSFVFVLKNNEI
jgi:hypothetical protein